MIIGCDLMVQLSLFTNVKYQFLQWDGINVPTKETSGLTGQSYLNSHEMHEVAIQNVEPVSKIEATERLMKNLDSTYAKEKLKHVADNATHRKYEERTQLLSLEDWYTDTVNL